MFLIVGGIYVFSPNKWLCKGKCQILCNNVNYTAPHRRSSAEINAQSSQMVWLNLARRISPRFRVLRMRVAFAGLSNGVERLLTCVCYGWILKA